MDEESQPDNESATPPNGPPKVQVVKPTIGTYKEPSTAEDLNEIKKEMSVFEKSMRRWTIATFFALAGTLIFVGLQWSAINGQLGEMKSSGRDTNALAVAALINARPWIIIKGTGFQYRIDGAGVSRVRATIIMANTGPAPALNVKGIICGRVGEAEPIPGEYGRVIDNICVQQPFGTAGKDTPFAFNEDDLAQIVPKGTLAVSTHDLGRHYYVWGKITYDISATQSSEANRFMTFCLLSGPDKAQMGSCQTGNAGD